MMKKFCYRVKVIILLAFSRQLYIYFYILFIGVVLTLVTFSISVSNQFNYNAPIMIFFLEGDMLSVVLDFIFVSFLYSIFIHGIYVIFSLLVLMSDIMRTFIKKESVDTIFEDSLPEFLANLANNKLVNLKYIEELENYLKQNASELKA